MPGHGIAKRIQCGEKAHVCVEMVFVCVCESVVCVDVDVDNMVVIAAVLAGVKAVGRTFRTNPAATLLVHDMV